MGKILILFGLFLCLNIALADTLLLSGDGPFVRANTDLITGELANTDLEKVDNFVFDLSGQTSVNLNVQSNVGAGEGTFVTRNSSANPNAEIAYASLAQMLGVGDIIRIAIPFSLYETSMLIFKNLIERGLADGTLHGVARTRNAHNILARIAGNPQELKGCFREKKLGSLFSANNLVANDGPNFNEQLFKDLQAINPKPQKGVYEFRYGGYLDRPRGAREFSVLMTLDSIFGQWDRYSGGNITYRKFGADGNNLQLYSADNGGADYWNQNVTWGTKTAGWFSRYDKKVIDQLRILQKFMTGRSAGLYIAAADSYYSDPRELVTDMGMYYENSPEFYRQSLSQHLAMFLKTVDANISKYGEAAVFL